MGLYGVVYKVCVCIHIGFDASTWVVCFVIYIVTHQTIDHMHHQKHRKFMDFKRDIVRFLACIFIYHNPITQPSYAQYHFIEASRLRRKSCTKNDWDDKQHLCQEISKKDIFQIQFPLVSNPNIQKMQKIGPANLWGSSLNGLRGSIYNLHTQNIIVLVRSLNLNS